MPEGPKAHLGHKEHRVMKDHLDHLAALALLEDLEERATSVNLGLRVYRGRKGTWETLEKLDHKVR